MASGPTHPPVVQRQLGVNQTITAASLGHATIRKVHNKVWVITDPDTDTRVVVRVEVARDGAAPVDEFDLISGLVGRAARNVPGYGRLTPAELAALANANIAESGGRGRPTLAAIAGDPRNDLLLKTEFKEMGSSLSSQYDEADAIVGSRIRDRDRQRATNRFTGIRNLLVTPRIARQLGRMAAADLVLDSNDRFTSSRQDTVNLENIDFGADGAPLAIDNYDPNTRIAAAWAGEQFVRSPGGRHRYAALALTSLLSRLPEHLQPDLPTLAVAITNFRLGMDSGARRLGRTRLLQRRDFGDDGARLQARIDSIDV